VAGGAALDLRQEPRRRILAGDSALRAILTQKTTHYGAFSRPTRLIIYYGQAAAYNTPYIGVETLEFADVAAWAAETVREQTAFEKIYLLNALQPGLEAFEIFPAWVPCR
jgi:hypothetical protein